MTTRVLTGAGLSALLVLVVAGGCSTPGRGGGGSKSPFVSATVTRYFAPGTNRYDVQWVEIADPAEVVRLASFFPGVGRGKRSMMAARWEAGTTVVFTRSNGRTVTVTTDQNNWGYWSEGFGDFDLKPGYRASVDKLFRQKKD